MGDYFKIYGTTKLADYKADAKDLDMMNDIVEKTLEPVNYAEIKKKIDSQLDSIEIGVPMLLEKYSKSNKSKTFVLLVKYSTENSSYMMVMSLNMLLLNGRIVNLAYYHEYANESDITAMKLSSDIVVKRVLDEN
jgi:predicted glutamine amidotransferase